MKKLISVAIVSLMIVALAIPAFATNPSKNNSFDVKYGTPTIDGSISEAEWGTPIVTNLRAVDAVSVDFGTAENDDNTTVYAQSSYTDEPYDDAFNAIYVNWDEDYLYLAIVYTDGDGMDYYAVHEGDNCDEWEAWKNDTFQIVLEPGLVNQGSEIQTPWGGKQINFALSRTVADDGSLNPIKGQEYMGDEATAVIDTAKNPAAFNVEVGDGYTVRYAEYAFSTDFLYRNAGSSKANAAGTQFQISICAINCNEISGSGDWAQYFSWGCGICGPRNNMTCGGANQLTFVAEKAVKEEEPPVTEAPTTDAPATDAPATDAPATGDDQPVTPPQTGDMIVVVIALAVVALGTAVVVKKVSVR